jgi:ribosome recycling factor
MNDYAKELESHLKVLTDKLKIDLQGVRSNRPSVELVENILVEVYDQRLPIKGLGSLTIQHPRDILISLWDKAAINPVMRAIDDARMGLSVSSEGLTIRAALSPLGDERRDELVKMVKKTGEETRIAIRNRRDEAMKRIKAAIDSKELSEDMATRVKDKAQKFVEDANSMVGNLVDKKIEELNG